jgi:TRAP transporter TAXI family solute receptor
MKKYLFLTLFVFSQSALAQTPSVPAPIATPTPTLTPTPSAGSETAPAAPLKFVTIGTGGVTGIYYAIGGAICRLANKQKATNGFRCVVESTGGSVYNVNAIKNGDIDFGVTQSDVQYQSFRGKGDFKKMFTELRSIMSFHAEPVTLVVRAESNIKSIADLKGKRINIGNKGSGNRAVVDELLSVLKMKYTDFAATTELTADDHGPALCNDKIDGFFYAVGHPSSNIRETILTCGAKIIPLTGNEINTLVSKSQYYSFINIPGGMYPGNDEPIKTYGVLSTLVTSKSVSDEVVYQITKAVFENIDEFKNMHPAWKILKPEIMSVNGLSAPLHNGAAKYYRERGWIK